MAEQSGQLFIYLRLDGFNKDAFVPTLEAVLEHVVGSDVVAADVSTRTDGTAYTMDGTSPTIVARARALWEGGITTYFIVFGEAAMVATHRARPASSLVWPPDRAVLKSGSPCHLPQAEIDLCRKKFVIASTCDFLPRGTDACREILSLINGASCERGPECGYAETCQGGVCCLLGTLACGSVCYNPTACQTCVDGKVQVRGGFGTGKPGKDCRSCSTRRLARSLLRRL